MTRDWRIILRFTVVGLSVSTIAGLSMGMHGPAVLTGVSVPFCPPMLFFLPIVWSSPSTMWLMFLFAAIANAALYAVVGAAYVGLRRKPGS
jgi:hypothetical protein